MSYYQPAGKRVVLLDEIRGFSILSMVLFHAVYDLVYIFGVSIPWWHQPWVQDVWQPSIACSFVLVSGIVCRYSRDNIRRGAFIFGCGMLMTAITYFAMPDQLILFGVLHLLGVCMMLFGVISRFRRGQADRIPPFAGVLVCFALFVLTYRLPWGVFGVSGTPLSITLPRGIYELEWLAVLGFPGPHFVSSDYFPLLPWVFLFAAGTYLGVIFRSNEMPRFMYRSHCRPLEVIGKRTIWIYLLHQPILFAVFTLVFRLLRS